MADSLWWALSAALILLGLAGIVLPALPGTVLVLAGIVVGAWIDDFTKVGWFTIAMVTVTAAVVLPIIHWNYHLLVHRRGVPASLSFEEIQGSQRIIRAL